MIGSKKWSKLDCLNCIEVNSSFYRIPNDKIKITSAAICNAAQFSNI
tara:strand:- start:790 stop:930 length:141 start_codon:yes stop_codon:yes gene_type:complete